MIENLSTRCYVNKTRIKAHYVVKYTPLDIQEYYHHTKFAYNTFWGVKKNLALHFGYWDETTTTFEDALKRENEILARMVKITENDYVLDAGCGVGGSSIYLSGTIGCKTHGVTIVPDQVEDARANAEKYGITSKAEFSVQDYSHTNFEDNTFDVIWSIESVCHAPSKEDFIKEAYRILKPGGRLIVADYFLSSEKSFEDPKQLYKQWISGWFLPYLESVNGFQSHLIANGFSSESLKYTDATENAKPSTKRLHDVSKKAKPIVTLLKFIRIRNKYHLNNIKASIAQYDLLKRNVWQYGIFSITK